MHTAIWSQVLVAAATDSLLVTANRGPPTLLKLALNLVAPQLGQSGLLNGTTVQQFGRLGGPSGLTNARRRRAQAA